MAGSKAAAAGSNAPAPIIVKKITIEQGGHHGGAWKVAYADFVTAMMAFFLLLWLLGATTEDQRKGLADYFTPTLVKLKEGSAGSDGFMGGRSLTDVDDFPHAMGQTGTQTITVPRDATGGPKEGSSDLQARAAKVKAMKEEIAARLEAADQLRHLAKQVRLVETTRGVRIDLVDDADFSMFRLGTTMLSPDASALLNIIGQSIAHDGSKLIIRGHTDALKWKAGAVSNNWSLSAARADATRQALMTNGIAADRFYRIEGVADRELLIPGDPSDPRNRRISIHLLDN